MAGTPGSVAIIGAVLLGFGAVTAAPAAATEPVKATISDAAQKTFASVTTYPFADPYVRMRPPDRTVDQQWELTMRWTGVWIVRSIGAGTCLSGHPEGNAIGAPVTVEPCAGTRAQLWEVPRFSTDGTVTFTNAATGLCLTQPKPVTADRRLREFRCDQSLLQRFRINRPRG